MWQRFTERSRRIILLAQQQACLMGQSWVGTEHLLIGLLQERESESLAFKVIVKKGLFPGEIITLTKKAMTSSKDAEPTIIEPKMTPKAKRILELAADEARRMRINHIGTEHLLIALIREKDGIASMVLRSQGMTLEDTRQRVIEEMEDKAWAHLQPPKEEDTVQTNFEVEGTKNLEDTLLLPSIESQILRMTQELSRKIETLSQEHNPSWIQEMAKEIGYIIQSPEFHEETAYSTVTSIYGKLLLELGNVCEKSPVRDNLRPAMLRIAALAMSQAHKEG